MGRANDLTE